MNQRTKDSINESKKQLRDIGNDNVVITEAMGDKEDEHNKAMSDMRQMYESEIQLMSSKISKRWLMRKQVMNKTLNKRMHK